MRHQLLDRITTVRSIFGGKPTIRGRRLAVEHVLEMLAAGDDEETILSGYRWLEPEDVQACLLFDQHMQQQEDWGRDRDGEWAQEVEKAGLGEPSTIVLDAPTEQSYEWVGDLEPDYDAEEDARTGCGGRSGRRVPSDV